MRHLDLCSGIGGFALAARWMGWETIGFAEIDEFASRVLEKHWPGVPNYGDIATVPDGVRADILTAGFPCQPYSVAGKQLGAEDDRAIWPLVIEVVRRVQPRWCVFENVAGIINMALDGVLSDLEAEGYEVGTVVLPACAVNAPHRRDRVWILGSHSERMSGSEQKRQHQWAENIDGSFSDDMASGEALAHARRFDSDGRRGERGGPEAAGTRDWITRSGEHADDVAYPAIRPDQQSESRASIWTLSGRDEKGDGDVSDPHSQSPGRLAESRHQRGGGQLEPRLGGMAHGIPGGMDGHFDAEPDIPRVATGIKNRAGRLKALGNAIVPQVAYQIFKAIEHGH